MHQADKKRDMKGIEIDKLILNISAGESGDRLTFATRVLEQLSGQKPCHGKARYTVRQFGIRRNENISSYVTVRGQKAKDIIERGLKCKEYELNASNFSATGNFGFGIRCVFIDTSCRRAMRGLPWWAPPCGPPLWLLAVGHGGCLFPCLSTPPTHAT